mgnify:FL=1|tara:strand:- start:3494 stop:3871 length:378 start_codon:yes stop_codon:yes gene_type:complete
MALGVLTIVLPYIANVSLQSGDTMYYSTPITYGDHLHVPTTNNIIKSGELLSIVRNINANTTTLVIQHDLNAPTPTTTSYLMFTKDNLANNSSLLGYYAEVKLNNNSPKKAELFSLGSEAFISSK